MRVLGMDVDEQLGEGPELPQGDGPTIDIGPRAAILRQRAAQQAPLRGVRVPEALGIEPGLGLGNGGHGKFRGQLRAGAALPHQPALGPIAKHEAQRIEHDGFAGARFPGDGREARLEGDGEGVDDRKVLNFKVTEHG